MDQNENDRLPMAVTGAEVKAASYFVGAQAGSHLPAPGPAATGTDAGPPAPAPLPAGMTQPALPVTATEGASRASASVGHGLVQQDKR